MAESIDAVEVMRVPKAIGINADAIYVVPGDAVHLAKIVVLGEDEEIDEERVERIYDGLSIAVDTLEECGIHFGGDVYCTTAIVWLCTDGSIAHVAIIAKGMWLWQRDFTRRLSWRNCSTYRLRRSGRVARLGGFKPTTSGTGAPSCGGFRSMNLR